MEIGMKTPPFSLCLFVMKGVVPPGIAMTDVYRAVLPFVLLDLLAMFMILLFPSIATVFPSLMKS
jgi:TRAP-type mannitol/chloroaromatic compound transport system permease large subunit